MIFNVEIKSNSVKKIVLSENHLRALSASLKIIEEYLTAMEKELKNPANGFLIKTIDDMSEDSKKKVLKEIEYAKRFIGEMVVKYSLSPHNSSLNRFISAHKSSIWVILSNTKSQRLKGYGDFTAEASAELDVDIDNLQKLINQM